MLPVMLRPRFPNPCQQARARSGPPAEPLAFHGADSCLEKTPMRKTAQRQYEGLNSPDLMGEDLLRGGSEQQRKKIKAE